MNEYNEQYKLISVIVPIYKVESYLRRGVDSILAQDYPNMEVILVDDGSPDNCGKICDEYAKQDKRVRVIHKSNGGLSSARNAGLDVAKGEYISFIDSDDSIMPYMYSTMIKVIEDNNLDIVTCGVQRIKNSEGRKEAYGDGSVHIVDGREALIDCLANDGAAVWCKVYTKKAIGDVRFPVGRIFEDSAAMYLFVANAGKVGYLNKVFYNYYYNGNSITQTSFTPKARWDYVLARKEAFEYSIAKKMPCIKECKSLYVKALLSCMTAVYACGTDGEKKMYKEKIIPELIKYKYEQDSYCKLNDKYKIWLKFSGTFDIVHIISAKISLLSKKCKKILR